MYIRTLIYFQFRPLKETTSLAEMLEYGLQKHLVKLEEIGASAAKEYSLEKALSKMKEDWKDLTFELVPYR